jgi:hypothetical protein
MDAKLKELQKIIPKDIKITLLRTIQFCGRCRKSVTDSLLIGLFLAIVAILF